MGQIIHPSLHAHLPWSCDAASLVVMLARKGDKLVGDNKCTYLVDIMYR